MQVPEQRTVLDYGLRFQPVKYSKETMIPATNLHLERSGAKPINFEEFLLFHSLIYAMEVYKLPERRDY